MTLGHLRALVADVRRRARGGANRAHQMADHRAHQGREARGSGPEATLPQAMAAAAAAAEACVAALARFTSTLDDSGLTECTDLWLAFRNAEAVIDIAAYAAGRGQGGSPESSARALARLLGVAE